MKKILPLLLSNTIQEIDKKNLYSPSKIDNRNTYNHKELVSFLNPYFDQLQQQFTTSQTVNSNQVQQLIKGYAQALSLDNLDETSYEKLGDLHYFLGNLHTSKKFYKDAHSKKSAKQMWVKNSLSPFEKKLLVKILERDGDIADEEGRLEDSQSAYLECKKKVNDYFSDDDPKKAENTSLKNNHLRAKLNEIEDRMVTISQLNLARDLGGFSPHTV